MATKAKTQDTENTAETPNKKQRRAVRLAKATNVAFSLEPAVRARFAEEAKAEGMELGHFLQKVLENHLLETAEKDDPLAERIRAKRAVIDHTVELAQKLDAEGKFDENFVLTVMKAAAKEEEFMLIYNTAIGWNEETKKAHGQKALNQQLGRLIRKSVGAKGLKTDAGRVARAQVSGEVISSYTLLTKQG
ncbi:hypothetical protein ACOXXX_19240 [Thalassococcus sp. BH17M4-6]|uniref:hypothetical protein n=1 Tax=Thalassococcus sp. BH17M4-6 TaxID=3413148 RepID=UPI003BCC433B